MSAQSTDNTNTNSATTAPTAPLTDASKPRRHDMSALQSPAPLWRQRDAALRKAKADEVMLRNGETQQDALQKAHEEVDAADRALTDALRDEVTRPNPMHAVLRAMPAALAGVGAGCVAHLTLAGHGTFAFGTVTFCAVLLLGELHRFFAQMANRPQAPRLWPWLLADIGLAATLAAAGWQATRALAGTDPQVAAGGMGLWALVVAGAIALAWHAGAVQLHESWLSERTVARAEDDLTKAHQRVARREQDNSPRDEKAAERTAKVWHPATEAAVAPKRTPSGQLRLVVPPPVGSEGGGI